MRRPRQGIDCNTLACHPRRALYGEGISYYHKKNENIPCSHMQVSGEVACLYLWLLFMVIILTVATFMGTSPSQTTPLRLIMYQGR